MALTKVIGKGIGAVDEITSDTAGTNNFVAGVNAGNSIASGGNDNTCVGDEAGTAITTGDNSVAVGYRAGDAITTGSSNIAIGRDALGAEVAGNKNIAIGSGALETQSFSSSADAYNIAIGDNAGLDLTDGQRNVLIGGLAGDEITDADDIIAIGYRSGGAGASSATTGHDNVCIGTDAGEKIRDGGQNVYIGKQCADESYTGSANVCIGFKVGSYTTNLVTGGTNTLIGSYTHPSTTDASSSVGLGHSLSCATGYATIGHGGSDIRAAHGNTTWSTVSDERYKKDIVDSTAGLSFINDLRPRTFKYKNLGDLPNTFNSYEEGSTEVFKNTNTNHGFIAQEVKTAIDAHSEIKDGFRLWDDRDDGSQEVAETALIPVLTKAVQELSAQVTALTNRITALENG